MISSKEIITTKDFNYRQEFFFWWLICPTNKLLFDCWHFLPAYSLLLIFPLHRYIVVYLWLFCRWDYTCTGVKTKLIGIFVMMKTWGWHFLTQQKVHMCKLVFLQHGWSTFFLWKAIFMLTKSFTGQTKISHACQLLMYTTMCFARFSWLLFICEKVLSRVLSN